MKPTTYIPSVVALAIAARSAAKEAFKKQHGIKWALDCVQQSGRF